MSKLNCGGYLTFFIQFAETGMTDGIANKLNEAFASVSSSFVEMNEEVTAHTKY